ncbi:FAD binding domain-containing protein [Epithele typhae]|uniref:FAD binding domain-containing protein n=1 Tax=Epithele typhae TaxID=378194 RepID=UPI002008C2DF|nr:FAD binding domain-containing protein [Epithele typhae]KAH9927960.1 FAD binding domain-containing protein [Epithele typhae]
MATPKPERKIAESYVDVLIIGAGPAGVMAAMALNKAGVSVRIVEQRDDIIQAGHADGIQPRTLEVLHSYGLGEVSLKRHAAFYQAAFYAPDSEGVMTVSHPAFRCKLISDSAQATNHQGAIEQVFIELMRAEGLEVQRSTVPTSLEIAADDDKLKDPHAYVHKIVLHKKDQSDPLATEVVHSKFVLGADGAHSWTRNQLDIRMEGDSSDAVWGVLDIEAETDFPDIHNQCFLHSEHGAIIIIPREDNLVRIYVQQPPAAVESLIDPATGRVDRKRTSVSRLLEQTRRVFAPYHVDVKNGKIDWWTVYVVGQRVADRYSVNNRAFIAGDACHTHTPKAGQGLNASMNDSHNLAWKLAYVLRGWGNLSLLSTYEAERRAIAQKLIAFDRKYSKFFDKPRSDTNLAGVDTAEFHQAHLTLTGFISGIGIRYNSSLIASEHQALAHKLVLGERMLPHYFCGSADARPVELHDLLPSDTRFKILVFGGDVSIREDKARLRANADALESPRGFLRRLGRGRERGQWEVFDLLCFTSAKLAVHEYLDFPQFFREDWKRVLADDTNVSTRQGGGGYEHFGIDPRKGAIVVVRPDGYVSQIAPLDGVDVLDNYFDSFLI